MRAFLRENLKLWYWLWMKPITLHHHLREIAPEIQPNATLRTMLRASRVNPRLRRFLWHCAVILLVWLPILSMLGSHAAVWGGLKPAAALWTDVALGAASGVMAGAAIGVMAGAAIGVAFGVAAGVAAGVATGVEASVVLGVAEGVAEGVASGVPLGVAAGVALGVAVGVPGSVAGGVALGVAFSVALGVAVGVAGGVAGIVAYGVAAGVAVGVAGIVGLLGVPQLLLVLTGQSIIRSIRLFYPLSPVTVLRHAPPHYLELIYLPVPGLQDLLLEVAPLDRALVMNTLYKMQVSPGLQSTARRVMLTLLVEPLERVSLLGDIPGRLETLPDFRTLLPSLAPILSEAVPAFSKVLTTALVTQLPSRRIELLSQAERRLHRLQDTLLASAETEVKAFLPMAAHWQTLLSQELTRTQEQAASFGGYFSPFVAGLPLSQTDRVMLRGREATLRWLERALTRPTHCPPLLLTGPGRIGKSSFLRWLPKLLPDHLALWIDGQGLADAPDYPRLLQRLLESLEQEVQTRGLPLPPLEEDARQQDPSACFFRQLEALHQQHPGGRILLCLDEYNALDALLRAGRLEESFLAALRAFLQRAPWLSLLLAGRKGLEALDPRWSRHLNNFTQEHLGLLPPEDARKVLTDPTGNPVDYPIQLDPAALESLLEAAGNHPFLLQAIGESLSEHLNEARRLDVRPEDVEPILKGVLRRQEAAFRDWYGECTPEEMVLMVSLTRQGPSPRATWDNDRHGAALDRLLRDVLILEQNEVLEVRIPLVKRFWQKQRQKPR